MGVKLAVTGTPIRIEGNKAIFQHGETTDVYNLDTYRIVPESQQPDIDTLHWIAGACDADQRRSGAGTLEAAEWGYHQLYGQK